MGKKKNKKKQLQDRIFIISLVNLNVQMDFWNFTHTYPLFITGDNCLTNSFPFGTNIPFCNSLLESSFANKSTKTTHFCSFSGQVKWKVLSESRSKRKLPCNQSNTSLIAFLPSSQYGNYLA